MPQLKTFTSFHFPSLLTFPIPPPSLHHYFHSYKFHLLLLFLLLLLSLTSFSPFHFNCTMLSHHTLNPHAQPFYLQPNQHQLLYFPRPICYYVPPSTTGFYAPFHAPISDPSRQRAKTDTFPSKLCAAATGNWRYHRKLYKWRVRGRKIRPNGTAVMPFPNTVKEAESSSITTVMIRNVPNQFKFDDLIHILDEHCLQQNKSVVDPEEWSKFDFVYLPVDYRKYAMQKRVSNLGYAFVNFTSPKAAFRFYVEFHGLEWEVAQNKKICQINVAQYQVLLSFQGMSFYLP
ncbi:protein terminal ear1 homolog [Vigna radiata var. radiata]|uniref:Protein terminal ear1 homolog n=1 Tax=Vigna radiata var. radiata TaxID=3916 RepID=A0A3Q0F5P1_VIGRR|nr:protein terminal ear1 homolog [Vigna radiata var. radiata]